MTSEFHHAGEHRMQYGFTIPCSDVHAVIDLAVEAENAGWDGVFIPDAIAIASGPNAEALDYDPWVALAAVAMRTSRIRMGTMLTPISRRRPWKLARETVTLDQLSHGRLILSVGLGALDDMGFGYVGEATDRKVRAQLMDEGLEILMGLWSGKPFSFHGEHYHVDEMTFAPTPVQKPRIPIWVVGAWPSKKSMRRVLRYDGLLPNKVSTGDEFPEVTPDDIRAMVTFIDGELTAMTPFDIVWEGRTPGDDPAQVAGIIQPYIDAGITWWLESMWTEPNSVDDVRARIRQGPPKG
ncbi:MAG TPA: LLM class flavin-dependent oxidoreductase [Ktedonobacterales bacterium]|nr:LLM class flavin-dependent oxidoreductase [Ktedonobacterales bacterium]